ncbi:hypothetical protein AAFF_G00227190 [Aldrovandia affinis]|uniref:Uncharacterized protein n=1 Tax=Aldrovandia affinis TaxID=143900 RepID=A0AAD7TCX7_9TELE|nr:hypothetical protein AAFF_G00227190 [Aldrovandia affinis]
MILKSLPLIAVLLQVVSTDTRSTYCEITKCLHDPFTDLLVTAKARKLPGPEELKRVLNMKDMCKALFNDSMIKKVYIAVERSLIKQLMEIPYEGEQMIYNLTDLAIKVVKINLTKLNTPDKTEDYIHIEAPLEPLT